MLLLIHCLSPAYLGSYDLTMVNNLSCNDNGLCSWSHPQCRHGNTALQYNLTVVQNNTVVLETTTSNTYWTYCPLYLEQYREFELIVTPFSSTLGIIGESVSTISGSKEKGILVNQYRWTACQYYIYCKQCKPAHSTDMRDFFLCEVHCYSLINNYTIYLNSRLEIDDPGVKCNFHMLQIPF